MDSIDIFGQLEEYKKQHPVIEETLQIYREVKPIYDETVRVLESIQPKPLMYISDRTTKEI
jgi:hypothetical protein